MMKNWFAVLVASILSSVLVMMGVAVYVARHQPAPAAPHKLGSFKPDPSGTGFVTTTTGEIDPSGQSSGYMPYMGADAAVANTVTANGFTGDGLTDNWGTGTGRFMIASPQICIASDAGNTLCTDRVKGSVTTNASYANVGSVAIPSNGGRECHATFAAWDYGSDAGYQGNFQKCSLEFTASRMSSGQTQLIASAGTNVSANYVPVVCVSQVGCDDAGALADAGVCGTNNIGFVFQVVADGGTTAYLQVEGPDTHTWNFNMPIRCEQMP